jgi:hypothetical protein
MHKTNALIIAVVLTAIIGSALTFSETLHQSNVIGIFYFPVFLLSAALSGGGHNPTAPAVWSSFIAYTLVYLVIFILVYAIVCEMVLLRRGFVHLQGDRDAKSIADEDPATTLSDFGRAVQTVEQYRRRHWVLKNVEELNLTEGADVIGARAIVNAQGVGATKGLLRELHRRIANAKGTAAADAAIEKLKADAADLVRAHDQGESATDPPAERPRAP